MPATHSQRRVAPAASGAGYWRNGGASLRSATEGAKGRHDGGSPGTVTTSLKLASSAIESHARGACAAAGGRRDGDTEGKIQNLEHENPSIAHRWAIGAVRRYPPRARYHILIREYEPSRSDVGQQKYKKPGQKPIYNRRSYIV